MEPNIELIKAWAEIISAAAWPVVVMLIAPVALWLFYRWMKKGDKKIQFKVKDFSVTVEPTKGIRPPEEVSAQDKRQLTQEVESDEIESKELLPRDYYFLNHSSFLRPEMQEAFQNRTGVPFSHYDIRVVVDSYYRGAMDRVEQVEYILHNSYPEPRQIRRNPKNRFLLKELANGEYVLMAKVYLKDQKEPIILQRYITLWSSGPRLDESNE